MQVDEGAKIYSLKFAKIFNFWFYIILSDFLKGINIFI